jgi:hypothetical protein
MSVFPQLVIPPTLLYKKGGSNIRPPKLLYKKGRIQHKGSAPYVLTRRILSKSSVVTYLCGYSRNRPADVWGKPWSGRTQQRPDVLHVYLHTMEKYSKEIEENWV